MASNFRDHHLGAGAYCGSHQRERCQKDILEEPRHEHQARELSDREGQARENRLCKESADENKTADVETIPAQSLGGFIFHSFLNP